MDANRDCERIRVDLPARRAGWLAASRVAQIAAHLAQCPACSAYEQGDERIARSIEGLEPVTPAPTAWDQVLASRRAPSRPAARPWRPALAFAAAAIAVAVGGLRLQSTRVAPVNQVGAPVASSAIGESGAFVGAHSMVSYGDLTTDPNRAILLGQMARDGHETQ